MSVEGVIDISLGSTAADGAISVQSKRPLAACRLLEQMSPLQALERVPVLFALCGKSQQRAALNALQAAGVDIEGAGTTDESILSEAFHEYLWRFLIDLPKALNSNPQLALFSDVRQLLSQLPQIEAGQRQVFVSQLQELIEQQILGIQLDAWRCMDLAGFEQWLESGDSIVCQLLKAVRASLGNKGVAADQVGLMRDADITDIMIDLALEWEQNGDIISTPQWRQQSLETGAWSYHQHWALMQSLSKSNYHPVMMRLIARIADMIELLGLLSKRPQPGIGRSGGMIRGSGIGVGWVKTARGLLVHHIMVENETVVQYRILAPTEWNFHPQGALAKSLTSWRELEQQRLHGWIDLQVLSLDPCVQYQVEIEHA